MATDRIVRVYQEDWWPFQNLPAALRRFSERTGIATELSWDRVGVGSIEKMFEEMLHSFTDDEPPFDVVCTDEVMLRRFAAEGRVLVLNELMARDGITLDDVTPATRAAVTLDRQVLGLPCVNVSNMLLYRRDLLERYGLPVPQSWDELKDVAGRLQDAVRRDGSPDFYGFATRGAPGGGHAVWSVSSFIASFGAAWFDAAGRPTTRSEAHEAALATYVDLLRAVAPPDQAAISFVELLRDFRAGRVGMILEVGMEYAHLFQDDPELAAKSGVALIPAGPAGRFANLYCPPYAIPKNSKLRAEAWELLKFLCSPAQLLEDGQKGAGARDRVALRPLQPGVRPAFPRRPARGRARLAGDRRRAAALFHPRHRCLHHRRRSHDQGADRRARDSRRARANAAGARPAADQHEGLADGLDPTSLRTDRYPVEGAKTERPRADAAGPARRAFRALQPASTTSSRVGRRRCRRRDRDPRTNPSAATNHKPACQRSQGRISSRLDSGKMRFAQPDGDRPQRTTKPGARPVRRRLQGLSTRHPPHRRARRDACPRAPASAGHGHHPDRQCHRPRPDRHPGGHGLPAERPLARGLPGQGPDPRRRQGLGRDGGDRAAPRRADRAAAQARNHPRSRAGTTAWSISTPCHAWRTAAITRTCRCSGSRPGTCSPSCRPGSPTSWSTPTIPCRSPRAAAASTPAPTASPPAITCSRRSITPSPRSSSGTGSASGITWTAPAAIRPGSISGRSTIVPARTRSPCSRPQSSRSPSGTRPATSAFRPSTA